MISRRSLLRAVPLLVAAPAIVRVGSLMPVRAQRELYGRAPGLLALEEAREYVRWLERQINPPALVTPRGVLAHLTPEDRKWFTIIAEEDLPQGCTP